MDKYLNKRLDGRYEIRELIGVGGMAYVYKAYDTIDDRIVAIKILRDEFLSNEEFTRRFKNESKAIAILSHPNIVKVFDVSFGDRIQYIVMEYIDGITLKEYMEQQEEINWKETVHFTVQILRALQHAHDKGIVHRDIKPQNIMLLPDGTIKVTDFGIARFARQDMRITGEAEKAIGSVHYISPEQARGAITDEKADIYSVGIMLYEMLTGQLPFEADNAVSVAIMQMQAEPKHPRDVNPEIPEGLEEITVKAMQKDPEQRYQSAAEMLYDIEEFKRNPSIHFAYKYFVDETPTKFVDTITQVRGDDFYDDEFEYDELEEEEEEKGPPVIPILAAITIAFVIVTVLFLGAVFFLDLFNRDKDKNRVKMPDFIGKTEEEVKNNPDYYGWPFKFDHVRNAEVEEGVIFHQDPKANQVHNLSQDIKLKVSMGAPPITVPVFTKGDNFETYKEKLEAQNLKAIRVPKASEDKDLPEGAIIDTNPKPGEEVKSGSDVQVFVNDPNETEPVIIPDVVKSNYEQAIKTLQGLGLTVNRNNIKFVNNTSAKENDVVEQTPTKGAEVNIGSEVTLVVSTGFRDVSVSPSQYLPTHFEGTVEFQVLIEGKVRPEYSSNGAIMPSSYSKELKLIENGKKENIPKQYKVTIRLKPEGAADSKYQNYVVLAIDGRSEGSSNPIRYDSSKEDNLPFLTTTKATTTSSTTKAPTTTSSSTKKPPTSTTTTDPDSTHNPEDD